MKPETFDSIDMNSIKNGDKNNEKDLEKLVSAVQFGDLLCVKEIVDSNSNLSRSVDSNGCSLLHWACINNR